MEPVNITYQLMESEIEAKEQELKVGNAASKLSNMKIVIQGKYILGKGVSFERSNSEKIDMKNRAWRLQCEGEGKNALKQFVPFLVSQGKTEELIYINLHELLDCLQMSEDQLRDKLKISGKDASPNTAFKIQLKRILEMRETSDLSELQQGQLVQLCLNNFIKKGYQHDLEYAKQSWVFVKEMCARPISEELRKSITIISPPKYNPMAYRYKAEYYKSIFERLQLSTTIELESDQQSIAQRNFLKMEFKLREWVINPKKETLSVQDIKDIHALLCAGLKNNGKQDAALGALRTYGTEITAGGDVIWQYVSALYVDVALQEFCDWLAKEMTLCKTDPQKHNPVILAALAYQQLVSIHPFIDGNGRTSRMVMDFILQKFGFPPACMEDPNVAIFRNFGRKGNISQDEAIKKVANGVLNGCKILGLPLPFASSTESSVPPKKD